MLMVFLRYRPLNWCPVAAAIAFFAIRNDNSTTTRCQSEELCGLFALEESSGEVVVVGESIPYKRLDLPDNCPTTTFFLTMIIILVTSMHHCCFPLLCHDNLGC